MSFPKLPFLPYSEPMPPVPADDTGGVCIEFDARWLPYVLTMLTALMSPTVWESDADRCSGEASELVLIFIEAQACIE